MAIVFLRHDTFQRGQVPVSNAPTMHIINALRVVTLSFRAAATAFRGEVLLRPASEASRQGARVESCGAQFASRREFCQRGNVWETATRRFHHNDVLPWLLHTRGHHVWGRYWVDGVWKRAYVCACMWPPASGFWQHAPRRRSCHSPDTRYTERGHYTRRHVTTRTTHLAAPIEHPRANGMSEHVIHTHEHLQTKQRVE